MSKSNISDDLTKLMFNTLCDIANPILKDFKINSQKNEKKHTQNVFTKDTVTHVYYVVSAPGFKKNEISFQFDGNKLILKAEQKDTTDSFFQKDIGYVCQPIYQKLNIPSDVVKENIQIKYEDGLLKIKVLKHNEKNLETIDIM